MTHSLRIPQNAGSREEARALLAQLPASLADEVIKLDAGELRFATPSFFDEIVKVVLVERQGARLGLVEASARARQHIERAGANRGVAGRIRVVVPA